MKTTQLICKYLTHSSMIMAIAALVSLTGSMRAQEMKGGERMMMLNAITTPEQVEALKPGDTVAMACPKCKTIVVEKVAMEKGRPTTMTPGKVHMGSCCQTSIVTVGTGKTAHNELKHVCKKCGSDDAFCATMKNAPSKDMDTEK